MIQAREERDERGERLLGILEAVLFVRDQPIAFGRLVALLDGEYEAKEIRDALATLREAYAGEGRGIRLEEIAGGYQFLTASEFQPYVAKLFAERADARLSPAAFETMAVIAYKQPITKAELESIRGVGCVPVLKTLIDKGLVRVVGRDDSLGRPLLYGTSRRFLEVFGLSSLRSLPRADAE
ncbi:MAG: SMC-Scp complex subunit ScpB [Planctomycetes bacterium]|nr:SMC-Scp complex subunit ScpB [Planctomycetota bacterium]